MKKIIEFLKEDWMFKVVMVIIAALLGVSQYFNYKADNAIMAELALVALSGVTVIGFITIAYYKFIKKKVIDVTTFWIGVALSVLFDVLSHLIF